MQENISQPRWRFLIALGVLMFISVSASVFVWFGYPMFKQLKSGSSSQETRSPNGLSSIKPIPSSSVTPSGIPEAVKSLVNSWCAGGIFGTDYVYDPLQKTLRFTATQGQEITVELLESEPQIEVFKELPAISQVEVRTVALSELSQVSDAAHICVLPKAGPDIKDQAVLFKAEEVERVYLY